jgi:hypothetical protein
METLALDLAFMVFGLGFFMFVINMIRKQDNADHERRIMELREFGFRELPKSRRRLPFTR